MAKSKTEKVTVEVDPEDLGVVSRHHFLMANDEDYRTRALTPPGGLAPGEGDKSAVELPDGNGLTSASLVAAAA